MRSCAEFTARVAAGEQTALIDALRQPAREHRPRR